MNKKGIFFTFIVFLLGIAIVLAFGGAQQTANQQAASIIEEAAFDTVNSRFENIYNEVITIKTGDPGKLQARILAPFDYDSGNIACGTNVDCPCNTNPKGCGWIQISQPIPIASKSAANCDVYNALNLYEVFIKEKSISGGLDIIASASKTQACGWSGPPKQELSYLILPQCIRYYPSGKDTGGNRVYYEAGKSEDNCTFDVSKIRQIHFSVSVDDNPPTMVKKPSPSFGTGDLENKDADYEKNPTYDLYSKNNLNPYIKIQLSVAQCEPNPACTINAIDVCCLDEKDQVLDNSTIIAGHLLSVSPLEKNGLSFQLKNSNPIEVYILHEKYMEKNPAQLIVVNNTSNITLADSVTKIVFGEQIEKIRFNAFKFRVSKPGFTDIKRGT